MGDDSPSNGSNRLQSLSRRQMLALSSAAGIAGIAGCSSDEGDTTTGAPTTAPESTPEETSSEGTPDPDSPDEMNKPAGVPEQMRPHAPEFPGEANEPTIHAVFDTEWDPTEYNLWYHTEPGTGQSGQVIQLKSLYWPHIVDNAFGKNPAMFAASNIQSIDDGCGLEITLRDNMTYYDGTPVTTEAVKIGWEIDLYSTEQTPDAVENNNRSKSLEVVDDMTFRWHFDTPQNAYNLGWTIPLGGDELLLHNPNVYGSLHEQYVDASSESAVTDVYQTGWDNSYGLGDMVEMGLGYGRFVPEEFSPTHMTWVKRTDNPDYPFLDSSNIERVEIDLVPDKTKRIEQYRRGDFDLVQFNDGGNVQVENLQGLSLRNKWGFNSIQNTKINYDNKHLARRGVRQAIAYLTSQEAFQTLAEQNGVSAGLSKYQVACDSATAERWIGGDWIDENLIDYGTEAKPEKAAEAMRSEGYTKDGDVWVDPDGERVEGLQFIAYGGIKKMLLQAQYVSGIMNDFGLKNELTAADGWGTWTGDYLQGDEQLDLTTAWSGGGYPSDVYFNSAGLWSSISDWYDNQSGQPVGIEEGWEKPSADGCQRIDYEAPPISTDTTPVFNHPVEPEVPDVGDAEGSPSNTLNPYVAKWTLEQLNDRDQITEIARQWAWYANWAVPQIAMYDEVNALIVDQENYFWGKEDWSGYWLNRGLNMVGYGVTEGRN